jgi:predicted Zn-dependent protease with MMP-like domain
MGGKRFRELVKLALDSLPSEFAQKLDNVEVVVENDPTDDQIRELKLSKDDLLFGLYRGVPQTKRGFYSGVLPDKIIIFKNSIEEVAKTEQEIKEKVIKVVVHEIGHHFGLSDEELLRPGEDD